MDGNSCKGKRQILGSNTTAPPSKRLKFSNSTGEDRIFNSIGEDRITEVPTDHIHHVLPSNIEDRISNSNGEDRISELPDDCLHHILSSLDTRLVRQCRVLSHRWKDITTSFPCFRFSNLQTCKGARKDRKQKSERFMTFVEKSLAPYLSNEKSNIQSFHLNSWYECYPVPLNLWISCAVRCGVEDLRLAFTFKPPFEFPNTLFTSESLKILELRTTKYAYLPDPTLSFPETIRLHQLQVLHLENLTIANGDNIVRLLANCPLLEALVIKNCTFKARLAKLDISHLHVKKLRLDCLHLNRSGIPVDVKICMPKLRSLALSIIFDNDNLLLERLTNLVEAKVVLHSMTNRRSKEFIKRHTMLLLNSLCNVKYLNIRTTESLEAISGPILLSSLRCLEVDALFSEASISGMTHLLKSSHQIESLIISITENRSISPQTTIGSNSELLSQLEGTVDNLKKVEMKKFQATDVQLEFLKHLLRITPALEKIKFVVSDYGCKMQVRKRMAKKKLQFLCASPSISVSFSNDTEPLKNMNFHVLKKQ